MIRLFTVFIFSVIIVNNAVNCDDDYFLKASKNIPRIGRNSKTNNEEFEKFFLKASKSVPRIGRSGPMTGFNSDNKDSGVQQVQLSKYPFSTQGKRYGAPTWSQIADIYEYNPELLNSPDLLNMAQGDDPSVYDWDKIRFKRTNIPQDYRLQNKELPENRYQPDA